MKAGSIRSEQRVRFSGFKVKTSVRVGFGGGKPEKSNTWGKSQDLCYGIPPSKKPPDPFDPSHDLRLPTPLFIEMIHTAAVSQTEVKIGDPTHSLLKGRLGRSVKHYAKNNERQVSGHGYPFFICRCLQACRICKRRIAIISGWKNFSIITSISPMLWNVVV